MMSGTGSAFFLTHHEENGAEYYILTGKDSGFEHFIVTEGLYVADSKQQMLAMLGAMLDFMTDKSQKKLATWKHEGVKIMKTGVMNSYTIDMDIYGAVVTPKLIKKIIKKLEKY